MGKSQKIKVKGKKHSYDALCPDEDMTARIKEHNLQILEDAAERTKKASKEKNAAKIVAVFALLVVFIIIKLFLT